MKRIFLSAIFIILTVSLLSAHETGLVSLGAFVSNEPATIPAEAASLLKTRMQRIIADDGYSDNSGLDRFVLMAKCDVLGKDIMPSTPPRISQELEITFLVADIIENKVYGSSSMTVKGIGANETKAFSNAFQKVSAQNPKLKSLLGEAKEKIIDYYTNHCVEVERTASTLASTGQYDKAIFLLVSVPNVCSDCFEKCQSLAAGIYQRKIDAQGRSILEAAKSLWAANSSSTTAMQIGEMLGQINPQADNYAEVESFRNAVASKLAADAKREWDMQTRRYKDNQAFKRSIVNACRDIGVTFAKNFQIPQMNLFKRH